MKEPKSSKLALLASLIGIHARETDQRTNHPTAVDLLVRNRFSQGFLLTAAFAIVALAGITRTFAGTFNANFDDGNTPAGATLNGSSYTTNTTGVNNSGCLHIVDSVGGQQGSIVLDDLDAGGIITGFTADFDIYIGGGTATPADGFSFCFGPDVSGSFGEEGSGTGLRVEFDTYQNAGEEIGIDIFSGGNEIVTGPQFNNAFLQQSGFVPCKIQANNDGSLTVVYNNQIVYTNFPGAFPATQGVFGLGGRTGGAWENCWIDNLQITTTTNLPAHPFLSSASPGPNSKRISPTPTITLNLTDTATQVNPTSILLSLNNANATPLNITKNGSVTSITYTPGGLFPSGSTNTIKLSYADNGTPVYSNSITYTFVVAVYGTLDPSFALSPADATAAKAHPGFYVQLVATDLTSQSLPNSNARSEYQLAGDLGPNVADLATGGYTDNSQLIPNLLYESAAIDYAQGSVPGIPSLAIGSANYLAAPTDNFSMAVFTAIQIDAAGVYTLGVNSDDGFRAYAGTNLVDRFQEGSINLGECDCGRGTADTDYTFNILQPGLYPFRVTYEEGGGGYAVHLYSRNPDGTKSVLNDSADPNAKKAFAWIAQQRAYIKSITPGANVPFGNAYAPNSYLTNGVTIVVGDGRLTRYVSGSAKMQWDGQDVTSSLTSSSAGGLTTIKYNPGLLVRATQHSVRFTYDETSTPVSTRTNDFVINIGPPQMSDLPATSFWIEAEDFDTKGQPVAAASTMPYPGGAFDTMPATFGIDYNNNDVFDTVALYRDFTTPDLVTSGKSVDIVNNLGNQWGTTRPGGNEMTVNYRIGWADSGEWYDYTRTIPAGVYGAYAGLSYGDFSANNMGGKLSIVTAGAGTANQTLQDVGQFDSDGSGGWGQNSLVPMHSLASGPRTPGYVKLPGGTTTVRFTIRSGDYDFFILTPATGVIPPVLSSTPSALASIRRDAQLAFTINDYSTSVATSSVKLTVDGQDVTSASTISKPVDVTTVTYKPTAMFNAGVHSYGITFADNGTPVNSKTVTNIFYVNPYPTPGTFVIEAEDFDYNGGSANPRAGIAGFDVNTMPYSAGAYSNLDAVLNVDYYNDDAQDSQVYRTNLLAHAGHNVDITGNVGGRWGADRGTYTLTNNFRIGWVNGGDWCDYTRTFPANAYQVWAALSNGDAAGTPHDMRGRLNLVTAGVGTTNQTLQPLGVFDAPASGAWGDNELVPMTDTNGVWQTVQMSGKQTVRFNMDNGDFDYFLFVPALSGPPRPIFATPIFVSAGSLRLQWTGSGTLQETGSLSPPNWQPAQSQANPQNVSTTTGSKYYRIFAP